MYLCLRVCVCIKRFIDRVQLKWSKCHKQQQHQQWQPNKRKESQKQQKQNKNRTVQVPLCVCVCCCVCMRVCHQFASFAARLRQMRLTHFIVSTLCVRKAQSNKRTEENAKRMTIAACSRSPKEGAMATNTSRHNKTVATAPKKANRTWMNGLYLMNDHVNIHICTHMYICICIIRRLKHRCRSFHLPYENLALVKLISNLNKMIKWYHF